MLGVLGLLPEHRFQSPGVATSDRRHTRPAAEPATQAETDDSKEILDRMDGGEIEAVESRLERQNACTGYVLEVQW